TTTCAPAPVATRPTASSSTPRTVRPSTPAIHCRRSRWKPQPTATASTSAPTATAPKPAAARPTRASSAAASNEHGVRRQPVYAGGVTGRWIGSRERRLDGDGGARIHSMVEDGPLGRWRVDLCRPRIDLAACVAQLWYGEGSVSYQRDRILPGAGSFLLINLGPPQ